jgi:hypothetical protein
VVLRVKYGTLMAAMIIDSLGYDFYHKTAQLLSCVRNWKKIMDARVLI